MNRVLMVIVAGVLLTASLSCEREDDDGESRRDGQGGGATDDVEECDPATDPDCAPIDVGFDFFDDFNTDTGPEPDGGEGFQTYHYILVQDQDENPSGEQPGADIDAVELSQNGASIFLSQIHESDFGPEAPTGQNADFNNALGEPEQQCLDQAPGDWDPATFVSLGGAGGYFVASFSGLAEVQPGDILTVHTCTTELSETWRLYVGVSTTITDPNWFVIIDGGVATLEVTVPNLPQVPFN